LRTDPPDAIPVTFDVTVGFPLRSSVNLDAISELFLGSSDSLTNEGGVAEAVTDFDRTLVVERYHERHGFER
jgi:hypothetical protein